MSDEFFKEEKRPRIPGIVAEKVEEDDEKSFWKNLVEKTGLDEEIEEETGKDWEDLL